ncbi:hypothetical protein HY004_00100 [Candidatus Saccharibacteria bacterium]|nr:hypothetical protein [Candidatus Saccharibacteria bacterium]
MTTFDNAEALAIAQEFVSEVHTAIQSRNWKNTEDGLCFRKDLTRDQLGEIAHSPVEAQALIVEYCVPLLSTALASYVTLHIVTFPRKKGQFRIELHIPPESQIKPASP